MADFSKAKFTKVSDYILARHDMKAGDKGTRTMLLDSAVSETDKALAFELQKWNSTATKLIKTKCWFPKKFIQKVENDFYVNIKQDVMYVIPEWLVDAKKADGFEI